MKYPVICNWITYSEAENGFIIYDELFGETYRMSSQEFDYYKRLDGKTDPYCIQTDLTREQVEQLLAWLEAELLIRKSRILSSAFGKVCITMIATKNCGASQKSAAQVADRFLSALWIPVLLSAVIYLINHYEAVTGPEYVIAGSIFGLVVGTVGHECGHAIACLAHGGKVFEFGVGWFYIFPSAYVLLSMDAIKSRRKRGHVEAAGIEINLLLTAICLYLACLLPGAGVFLFYAAIQNAVLALFNLVFVKGIDGLSIISEYVGCEDLIQYAKEVVADEEKRYNLCHNGINGVVLLGVCYIALFMQIGLPLLVALNLACLVL